MALPASRQLDFDEIPLLDIGGLDDPRRRGAVVEAIDRACTDIGFFYLTGHGFDMRLAARLLRAAQRFFDQPEEARLRLGLDPSMRGYLPLHYHSRIDASFSGTSHQEGFWIGADFADDIRHPLENANRWPAHPPELRAAMGAYRDAIDGPLFDPVLRQPERGCYRLGARRQRQLCPVRLRRISADPLAKFLSRRRGRARMTSTRLSPAATQHR